MLPVLLATLAAAVPTADCSQHVEGRAITPEQHEAALRRSVRVGGATFFGLRDARAHDFTDEHVFKSGLGVRAGAPLRIRVAVRDRSWLALDYDRTDRSGKGAPEVRVIPCDPDTPRFSDDGIVGEETGYAGGFVARRNGCATLLVRREGARERRHVRVAFGARCR